MHSPTRFSFFPALVALTVVGCQPKSQDATLQPVIVTTDSGVTMVLIPDGRFTMGRTGGGDESPRHEVTISAFAIDQFEVTQDQYAALQLPNPSHFKGDRRPVEQVRWSDAALACNERSRAEGLQPCYDEGSLECDFDANGYRLPTEAEWEYAARAGSDGDYYFGSSPQKLKSHACYAGNTQKMTDPVGRKKPNPWGLYDLAGNVAEWCHDAYDPNYYETSPAHDPRGPETGEKRVLRGGSWNSSADACRVAARSADDPGISDACFARDTYGYRCVRRLLPAEMALLGDGPPNPSAAKAPY